MRVDSFGRVGLGAMLLSVSGRPPREQAIATVHASLDAGVRLIDTADAYCLRDTDTGHNERLVRDALASWPGADADDITVATKGGHVRDASGGWQVDGTPRHLLAAAEASRQRLGVGRISLYHFHRPDPAVPFLQSIGALVELQRRGVIDQVGVSNVSVEQADAAAACVDLASVQNELSPFALRSLDVLAWCHTNNVAFLAWAPLGGTERAQTINGSALDAFGQVADELDVATPEVILAWICSLSPVVSVIPGSRRPDTARSSATAATLTIPDEALTRLDHTVWREGRPF